MIRPGLRLFLLLGLTSLLGGCVLAPREAKQEAVAMREAGRPYERPFEARELPELSPEPTLDEVLRRAFLANGELEATYHEWAAAVHRIQQAGGYPNTPLSIGFEQMFEGGTRGFDNTSVSIGPDMMENLAFPPKVYQAAKVATNDARAAGKRFVATRLDIQQRVVSAWAEYALLAERLRIQRENLALLRLILQTATARVQAGAAQQDLLRAEIEYRQAEDQLRSLEAELPQARARLNAMIARPPEAPLEPPDRIPGPRPLPADDAALLAVAAENNPELAALALSVRGREDAVELARLQLIPDFNPFGGFTGTVSQVIGLGISIPTFLPEVQGMIRESRSDLRRMQAMYRQAQFDQAGGVVAALYALRDSERRAKLFREVILPAAERIVDNTRQAYTAGTGSFVDLIESQRTLLEARLTLAEALAARERTLADLEALAGADLSAEVTGPVAVSEAPFPESSQQPQGPAESGPEERDQP